MLFDVATPIAMMHPISAGTLMVVPVTNSAHRMPARAPGSAIRMMSGSSHDWKLTTIRKYTNRTAKQMPSASWRNDWFMDWTCPRTTIELALEISFVYFATNPLIRLDTEPRSVSCTAAYTSNTGCTL